MKKKGKKLISIALTVAMIAGLTACGKGNGGNGNGGSSAADASLAKQYVFKEQALDLNMDSDNMNIDLLTRKGDTIYLLFEIYDYSDNGSQSTLHLATMKPDGTVIDTVELPMWKEGEAPATPAPAQGGEASGDGNEAVPQTEQEASTQDIAAADMDVVDAPAGNSSYTYTSLNNCTVGSDGNVYGIRNYYSETYSDDDYSSTNDYALICWSADGTIKWEADLNDMNTEESYSWVYSIIPNEDGTLTLLLSGDKIEKCTVTQEGITDRKELPEAAATLINNASSNIITPDGKLQIIYYDESNYTDMYIATYDPATDAVSEGIKLSSTLTNGGYYNMVPGDGDILYYADSMRSTRSAVSSLNLARVSVSSRCFGPVASAVIYGWLMEVWLMPDSSIFAFSAASFRRCIAMRSPDRSMPFDFLNSETIQSMMRWSKSSPPRWVSPAVDRTSRTPSPMSRMETSNVPPPRSYTMIFCSDSLSTP